MVLLQILMHLFYVHFCKIECVLCAKFYAQLASLDQDLALHRTWDCFLLGLLSVAEKLNSLRKWVLPTRLSNILGNQRRGWCQLYISTESIKKFNLLEAESSFGNLHSELCHGQVRLSHLDYSWICFGLARLFLIHQMLEFP